MFKPGHRKTLVEMAYAVSTVFDQSADFPDPSIDVPIVEDDIVKENSQ